MLLATRSSLSAPDLLVGCQFQPARQLASAQTHLGASRNHQQMGPVGRRLLVRRARARARLRFGRPFGRNQTKVRRDPHKLEIPLEIWRRARVSARAAPSQWAGAAAKPTELRQAPRRREFGFAVDQSSLVREEY